MASSSSAIDSCNNYDVFLSFRGEDTRYSFTSHLHKSLLDHNIKVFIDYNIRRGQEITLAIERVIACAKMSIIVFSKNYAESTFCLDELAKIMECRELKEQIVVPIFYKVEPLEEIYREAFARHEQRNKQLTVERLKQYFWSTLDYLLAFESQEKDTINLEMKVEAWKSAFRKALGLAGEHIDDKSNEAERIEKVTSEVLATMKELNKNVSKGEELICMSLVGQTAENNFKKIWEDLMNDKISRVGIYGMGGVGKTTIATCINNQLLEVKNPFNYIYWVKLSKDSSIYKLQSGIAKKINLDLSNEDDEKRRAAMIRKELKNNKFLLILDDVWEAYELTNDVGLPPLVGAQKLLLTTRSLRVCEIMECLPVEVKPLSKHEALDLFVKESKFQINDSRERRDTMNNIVEECGGLPLAIVVVARTMKGVVTNWKWRDTLLGLQKQGENPEMQEKVFKVLKFSYDRLSNDRCRQCFLYCSLFPEDHKFQRDDLINYWIAEGLIDELDSKQAELDKGNVIIDELMHSSLLETSDMLFGVIKMHDVIRDMARNNVKVGLQIQDPLESVQVPNKIMLKSFPSLTPHCSKIKTLVLQCCEIEELSSCFFTNMQNLNVLHIYGTAGIKSIPDSITNLGNLKMLIIMDSFVECIPSLIQLEALRHLKISWNECLEIIPKGIERLVNLRILDLSWNESLRGSLPSGIVEKLFNLQALDLNGSKVEVEPETLINLEKLEILRVDFYNLHKLNCYIKSGHWRRLLDYQINYRNHDSGNGKMVMSLKVISDAEEWNEEGIFLPENVQNLQLVDCESPMFDVLKNATFADLQTIRISVCKSWHLFTVDLAQQLLHNVRQLQIESCYKLKEMIVAKEEEEDWANRSNYVGYPTIVLPNLKILTLFDLPKLKSIYKGRMMCSSLELIQIELCDNVERLPFCMRKDGNNQNSTIKLQGWNIQSTQWDGPVWRRWWDSLQWGDPNAKLMYNPIFT